MTCFTDTTYPSSTRKFCSSHGTKRLHSLYIVRDVLHQKRTKFFQVSPGFPGRCPSVWASVGPVGPVAPGRPVWPGAPGCPAGPVGPRRGQTGIQQARWEPTGWVDNRVKSPDSPEPRRRCRRLPHRGSRCRSPAARPGSTRPAPRAWVRTQTRRGSAGDRGRAGAGRAPAQQADT